MPAAADSVGFHARLRPDRIAARDLASGRSYTYRQLDEAVGRCTAALTGRGIEAGERVAALARNRVELVILHAACARLGALYVPLNWRLSPAELGFQLQDAEPALVLGDALLGEKGVAGIALADFIEEIDACEAMPAKAFDREQPSLILYTSGTSGRAKGVLLSERNLDETAINFSLLGRVTSDSVFLCDAPMFHVIGLVTNIRPAFLQGASILVSDGFIPARTLERLGEPGLGISHYFCVPQMAAALRAEPAFDPAALRRLTAIFTGGAPHPAASIREWLDDGIAIVDGFGMTEAGTVFGMPLEPDGIGGRAGSSGIATPRVATRIVDENGDDCAIGQPGELLLKGGNITQGYWRRQEETRAAFTDDGWFRTGDVARADAEGFHWLVDRRKDMFISGGENVYPAEVEAALAGHPGIAECAVVGVADSRWGEVGHLFVVARMDAALDLEEIAAFAGPLLAGYKIPKRLSVIASMPRNAAGKLLKAELRDLASGKDRP